MAKRFLGVAAVLGVLSWGCAARPVAREQMLPPSTGYKAPPGPGPGWPARPFWAIDCDGLAFRAIYWPANWVMIDGVWVYNCHPDSDRPFSVPMFTPGLR